MADKQIIIDGVDVSECIYFCDGYCNDNNDGFKCSLDSEHCYYKQLKRKEQECEELKEELLTTKCMITTQSMENGRLYEQLDQLKATLTEIKEIINEFAKEDILTFPDFSKEQNYKLIQKQCGEPILKILQKISECEEQ